MRFSSEEEKGLLEPGMKYDAEVIESVDHVSKSGKECFKVSLRVFKGEQSTTQTCYLSPAWFKHRIVHLCRACGLKEGEDKTFDAKASDFLGKNVVVIMAKERGDQGFAEIGDFETASTNGYGEEIKPETPQALPDSDIPF